MSLTEDVLASLLAASRLVGADELEPLVQLHAEPLGAVRTTVMVVDLQQATLSTISGSSERVRIEGTVQGHVFTTDAAMWSTGDGSETYWVPLLDGIERLGVIGFEVDSRTQTFEELGR